MTPTAEAPIKKYAIQFFGSKGEGFVPPPGLAGYEPFGACKQLIKSRSKQIILSGPAGCIAGETYIGNRIIEEYWERQERPIVSTLYGPVEAEVPFIKGTAPLYRVRLENDLECPATDDHLFLSRDGWRFVSDLSPDMELLSTSPEDALRLSGIDASCQDGYQTCCRPCDQPLRYAGVQVSSPSRYGARERTHDYSLLDDLESTLVHSHSYPVSCLPSTRSLAPQKSVVPLDDCPVEDFASQGVLCHACQYRLSRDVSLSRWPFLSRQEWLQLQPFVGQPLGTCNTRPICRDESTSIDLPFSHYRPQWVPITSIKYTRTDRYFDLHVPGAEHYLANGIWSHNTGKSRACLEKCNLMLMKYPRIRGLMARKTRHSMNQSCIVTFEQKVLPHPKYIPFNGQNQEYRYPNGSIFALSGLDDPTKIYSSEWDFVYINQAEELKQGEWEDVNSRIRNGQMPYQQIIGDVNPADPKHWIKSCAASGVLTLLESRHEDNPVFWNREKQDWTDAGRDYVLGTLESLSGVRKKRLRYGIWAGAEGAVYEESWDVAHHVIDRSHPSDPYYPFRDVPLDKDPCPKDWRRFWSIDFGYNHPFCWQAWAQDHDGRLFRYKELYKTHIISPDAAKFILSVTKDEPKPIAIICDHDAGDRAILERVFGMKTTAAWKSVSPGIQAVEARLRKDGTGRARMFWLRDSQIDLDQDLLDKKLPATSEDEFDLYVWETSMNRKKGEEPKKEFDHGKDCERYLVAYVDDIAKQNHSFFKMISVTKSGNVAASSGTGTVNQGSFRMPTNSPRKFGH